MKTLMALALAALCGLCNSAAAASNTLTWKVTDEKNVFGYIVYRSEHREGPFLRASARIIRNPNVRETASPTKPSTYRFEDEAVEGGHTYHYFIDAISIGGHKQRLSGVISRSIAIPQ